MKFLRKIGVVFMPIYFAVTHLRNWLYDTKILRSISYDFPVLAVGNLSTGGTGKSPMIEYLVRLLRDKKQLATLSRGYGRETTEFRLVSAADTAKEVGDEPLQFKKKFAELMVAVDGNRANGIAELRAHFMPPQVVLLDDAFQHRKVKAGLYILLTTYQQLYVDDHLLPLGDLRESIRGARRAQIIVVTKCPVGLALSAQERIKARLALSPSQSLYFSKVSYAGILKNDRESKGLDELADVAFSVVTGIANADLFVDYFTSQGFDFDHLEYPDHHDFTEQDLNYLKVLPMVITTEKDYVRLAPRWPYKDTLWYMPMEMEFIRDAAQFSKEIFDFVGLSQK